MNKLTAVFVVLLAALAIGSAANQSTEDSSHDRPRIVAKVALTGQTANIPVTTIFTPKETGLFRVSYYLTQTVPSPNSASWTAVFNWTDAAGPENVILAYIPGGPPPAAYAVTDTGQPPSELTFSAVAGTPVTYQVYAGSQPFEIYLVIERLI